MWVYVSGLGQYEESSEVTRLGYDRTVESCLAMLESDDAILREGAARDLGRLAGTAAVGRSVSRLTQLLNDDMSPFVRRGAAEGLGLIGTVESFDSLHEALVTEQDVTTKSYIEEGLSITATFAVLDDPLAVNIPDEQAFPFFSKLVAEGKINDWKSIVIARRVEPRQDEAMAALAGLAASVDPDISKVAGVLKSALEKIGAK